MLKAGALSFVVLLALLTVSATGAQAAEFHSETQKTFLSGEQTAETVFSIAAGKVKCKKGSFSGETIGTGSGSNWHTSSVIVTPVFSECTVLGVGATAKADSGCHYEVSIDGAGVTHVKIIKTGATACKGIVVTVAAASCTVTFPPQTPGVDTVDTTNQGSEASRDVLLTPTVSKLTYTVAGPGTLCGSVGTFEGGTYTSSITEKGFKNEAHTEQVGVWIE